MNETTICVNCKHCMMEICDVVPAAEYTCRKSGRVEPVTGWFMYDCCSKRNNGHCEDYEEKFSLVKWLKKVFKNG